MTTGPGKRLPRRNITMVWGEADETTVKETKHISQKKE